MEVWGEITVLVQILWLVHCIAGIPHGNAMEGDALDGALTLR